MAETTRYFSTWGPADGPIRHENSPGSLGIVAEAGAALPIGQADPVDVLEDSRGPIKVYRLRIGGQELPGRWMCWRREFVPVDRSRAGRDQGGPGPSE